MPRLWTKRKNMQGVGAMTFKARYIHRRQQAPEYWRTIQADNLNDAARIAERYAKKGYIMVGVSNAL
jgi:hypothetical protein